LNQDQEFLAWGKKYLMNPHVNSYFIYAIDKGDINLVDTILNNKLIDVNTKVDDYSPVYYALILGKLDIAEKLLTFGANLDDNILYDLVCVRNSIKSYNAIKFILQHNPDMEKAGYSLALKCAEKWGEKEYADLLSSYSNSYQTEDFEQKEDSTEVVGEIVETLVDNT
jgi:hypothetical protein